MVTTISEFQWNNAVWREDIAVVHIVHFCWDISTSRYFFSELSNIAAKNDMVLKVAKGRGKVL